MGALAGLLVVLLPILPWAVLAGAVMYGPVANRFHRREHPLGVACFVGGLAFAAGFFGPMLLTPGANQGPMLGIFITGPLGLVAGFLWGLWRAARR